MPTTVTPSKTQQSTALVAWQDIASAAQVFSSSFDVSTKRGLALSILLGRATGTAFTAGWPNVRVEAQTKSGGQWIPIDTYQMLVGASIVNTTLNGAVSAAASSIVVTSATNIAVGDILFLGDSSAANYELARVKAVSGTTITLEEALLFAHANSALVTDQAEMIFPAYDVTAYYSVRVVIDNANSGQGIKAQVLATTYDADSF